MTLLYLLQVLKQVNNNHLLLTPQPNMALDLVTFLLKTEIQQETVAKGSQSIEIRSQILPFRKGADLSNELHLQLSADVVYKLLRVLNVGFHVKLVFPVELLPEVPKLVRSDLSRNDGA